MQSINVSNHLRPQELRVQHHVTLFHMGLCNVINCLRKSLNYDKKYASNLKVYCELWHQQYTMRLSVCLPVRGIKRIIVQIVRIYN